MKKLDISLAELVFKIRAQAMARLAPPAATAKPAEAPDDCIPDEVEVMVWFTGPDDDLRALGFTGTASNDDDHKIATGRIPTARLLDLAALENVIEVYGSEPLVPHLNYSVPEIRADALRMQFSEYTGEGVVIVIIDSGYRLAAWLVHRREWQYATTRVLGHGAGSEQALTGSIEPGPASEFNRTLTPSVCARPLTGSAQFLSNPDRAPLPVRHGRRLAELLLTRCGVADNGRPRRLLCPYSVSKPRGGSVGSGPQRTA